MNPGLIVVTVAVGLFAISLVVKRRFGVLGLGLAAGVVLASQFSEPLASVMTSQQLAWPPFSNQTVALTVLVLAPAFILLAGGPKYDNFKTALLGSIAFIVMAAAILVEPLSHDVVWLQQNAGQVVEFLGQWRGYIVALGVVLAVLDMFLVHNPKLGLGRKRH